MKNLYSFLTNFAEHCLVSDQSILILASPRSLTDKMKKVISGCLLFLLAACSSPSPQYFGIDAREQIISGVRFDVYQREDNAQAIRLQGRLESGRAGIRLAAILAIESATGCAVIRSSVDGDNEVINALLTCT